MQTTVNISPKIMTWLVQNRYLKNLNENMSEKFKLWQSGQKKPTFKQVEDLSKATNIPLGYFFLETPPTEDIKFLEYRTISSLNLGNPSRNLMDTIYHMESVQDWMKNYLITSEQEPFKYIKTVNEHSDIYIAAECLRDDLSISMDWATCLSSPDESFKLIRKNLGETGVLVMMNGIVGCNTTRILDISEFRAFTLIDEYAPLIFINSNDSYGGKLFSLIHETVHIWVGRNNFFNDRDNTGNTVSSLEAFCNAVTAELLVPEKLFREKWKCASKNDNDILDYISKLANYFNCGITVIARKALTLQYIPTDTYRFIAKEAIKLFNIQKAKKTSGGGNYYSTMTTRIDKRFLTALANSLHEGSTLYTDAFRLTNTSRKTFENLIRKQDEL